MRELETDLAVVPAAQPRFARVSVRSDPLWRAVKLLSIPRGKALQAVFYGFLSLGSAVALGAVSAWLIARASQMPPVLTLSVAVVSVRAFGISRGVFRYVERLASHDVALTGMSRLRAALYERLSSGSNQQTSTLRRGDLLARVGADVDHVGDVVVRGIFPALVSATVSLASVVAMFVLLPQAGIFLAAGLAIASFVGPWLTARGAAYTEADASSARSDVSAVSLDIVENVASIQVANRMQSSTAALKSADSRWVSSTDRGARATAAGAAASTAGMALAVLGALWFGIPAVINGSLADVALAVIVLTPLAAFESTTVLPTAALQFHRSRQAAARLMQLWDDVDGASGDGESSDAVDHTPGQATSPTRIQTDSLSVGWQGKPVSQIPDLTVLDGESVMIVGPSGAGKTTLLATLSGLLPAISGTVSSSGVSVFTAEDAHIFTTTILENLRVARGDVTHDEALEVLDRVGLSAWITGLPDGLETVIGGDASTISGGERRRVLIARALLAKADVLLFDEPAEHLDAEAGNQIIADLLNLPSPTGCPRAVLVASHHRGAESVADHVIEVAAFDSRGM